MTHIGERPTDAMYRSGLELDCQCARCGSSVHSEHCTCDDGWVWDRGQADDDEFEQVCPECRGRCVLHVCLSSPEWCQANPLPGREDIKRGQVEWFTID